MGKMLANKLLCKRSFENVEPRILTVTELTQAAAIREYKPAAVRAPSNCVSSETRILRPLKISFHDTFGPRGVGYGIGRSAGRTVLYQ